MITLRRLGLFAVIVSALIGAGIIAGRLFPRNGHFTLQASPGLKADSAAAAAWRRQQPWLFRDSSFSAYADTLLLPWFLRNGIGPRSLTKHSGYLEVFFPRGRPIHEYAFELESRCGDAKIRVLEGRELEPPGERVEYRLQAPLGRPLTLRVSLGKSALPGAARLALVIIGLDKAGEPALLRLLSLPFPLTLVLPANSDRVSGRFPDFPPGKEALAELPMEPVAYPYVKPGPDALFIHHSRAELQRLMDVRLRRCPAAKGFATTYGDRAIGNRPMMQKVLEYARARSLLFLDLTASPRSLVASVAQQVGASAFSARAQDPGPEAELESELSRRSGVAQKTGEGIWALRYTPGLSGALERLWRKHEGRFGETGLEWVPLSGLRKR